MMEKRFVPPAQINLLINVDRTDDPSGRAGRASRTFDTTDAGAGARNALELADAIDFHGLLR